jgi:hypothetical protein
LLLLLQVLAQVEEGSAHELAFSMLLSLALIPSAQQLVADQGEVQQLVQVRNHAPLTPPPPLLKLTQLQQQSCSCTSAAGASRIPYIEPSMPPTWLLTILLPLQVMAAPPSRAVRLEVMLVLGRLAARNRACQQDAVREGVVPVLVEMMMDGEWGGARLLESSAVLHITHASTGWSVQPPAPAAAAAWCCVRPMQSHTLTAPPAVDNTPACPRCLCCDSHQTLLQVLMRSGATPAAYLPSWASTRPLTRCGRHLHAMLADLAWFHRQRV